VAHGDVAIREVEAGDVGEVVALLRAVLAEFGLTFGEGSATDAQVLALPGSYRDHGGHFWVARDAGGVLLGTCGAWARGCSTPRSAGVARRVASSSCSTRRTR
jgi:hypothetical protein